MASTPVLRNGNAPSRPTTANNSQLSIAEQGARFLSTPAPIPARRLVLPTRYMELEPPRPLSAINDDPVFNTRAAATIIGVSYEQMKKWRQRGQGPRYYQYGEDGPVRYPLSALKAFKADHLVEIKKEGR